MLIHDHKTEIWRDVVEYNSIYQVSNMGRVRSIDRWVSQSKNNSEYSRKMRGRIIKSRHQNSGYLVVWLSKNGKSSAKTVHRLVATAFINNPLAFRCVNHKDGNKENNCPENLEWCSHSLNLLHAYKTLKQIRSGTTVICVDLNISFKTIKDAGEKLKISAGSICHALSGRNKTAGGYKWEKI